ncbi:primosomal protein N' [Methylomicrobium sp. Wu6]|uniref:primosomal protein N' n=1 Tax=Methylomicrobium sp. Wu6 TaxID=3107928 RepID=UPI002DD6B2E6|nr:primosomal protein N' [Methylomicrobium sp. Wu6]MEC4749991.1 primosomal protein N' [Methylomicrobium sp. Wu6]
MTELPQDNLPVLRVALDVPLYRLFDYEAPEAISPGTLKPGMRLLAPFGKTQKIAYLVSVEATTELSRKQLKPVVRVLDPEPLLSPDDLRLLHWASRYYHHPLGEVFAAAFPAGLRQGKAAVLERPIRYVLTAQGKAIDPAHLQRAPKQKQLLEALQNSPSGLSEEELSVAVENWRPSLKKLTAKDLLKIDEGVIMPDDAMPLVKGNPIECNPEQAAAVHDVCDELGRFGVFLLEGVTGSGKTEVYMQIIQQVLASGEQVLVLLPEITLTPQLENRFRQRFAVNIAVSHSKLTDAQRQTAWLSMQQGTCSILLGTRSALFTPLPRPGLIILDEEHDTSFKQQEGFRFSARDVAVVRGKLLNIPVLLGSATPSLESLYNAQSGRYRLLQLPNRAGNASAPRVRLLDIRNKALHEGISAALLAEIRQTLDKNEQVLLFLNRRGFAPTLICHDCGWVARCVHCDANLVIHFREQKLRCHHCASEKPLVKSCPSCTGSTLTPLGLGTERVEKVLPELFPGKNIIRLDRDTTQRKGALENYLQQINEGHADIILGTQMLAKGHHFPNVTLVAILDTDSGLYSIDFHAAEKLAQMIVQVVGRAGRADKLGTVILQTRHPEHPLLTTLIREGYNGFARQALDERKAAVLPPFSYQALLRVQAMDPFKPKAFLEEVKKLAAVMQRGETQVLGPVAAPMAKRAGLYRYQLLLQDTNRQALQQLLDSLTPAIDSIKKEKNLRWSLDVDPVDLY